MLSRHGVPGSCNRYVHRSIDCWGNFRICGVHRRTDQNLCHRWLNFAKAPLEKTALALVGDQLERPFIALSRILQESEATQQIRPRRVQEVITVKVTGSGKLVDELNTLFGTACHRDSYGAIQRYDRRRLEIV